MFEMTMAFFLTDWTNQLKLTYQSRPIADLFNSCVFHPILIKFGLGATIGLKRTLNEFEITMAIFLTDRTNQSKPA